MGRHYFARDPGKHYYKCVDCLAPVCIDTTQTGWREDELRCPHCAGDLDWMGRVADGAGVVINQTIDCPCDERCTCAVGPNCDCRCGGQNHGIGIMWKTIVVGDTVKLEAAGDRASRDSAKHSARGREWQALVARYHRAWDAAFDDVTKRRNAGWIPLADFRLWVAGQNTTKAYYVLRGQRSHARNAKLEKLIEATEALAAAQDRPVAAEVVEIRRAPRAE